MAEDHEDQADQEEIEKNEEAQKQQEAYSRICLETVMSNVNGRHFVWELLADCGIYQDTFSPDPYIHARASGSRKIGLKLMQRILEECPGMHETMFSEHKYKEGDE